MYKLNFDEAAIILNLFSRVDNVSNEESDLFQALLKFYKEEEDLTGSDEETE